VEEPPKHEGLHGNHPADGVSWYDAAAFCHWLSARLSGEIRLPTEFEWRLAATGGDRDRIYPWGSHWDPEQEPWRANTRESNLRRSTAVGLYPLGASKTGLLDMAGTLWEWCLNAYDDPSETGFSAKDDRLRVLRGGSWNDNRDGARCAVRGRGNPNGRSGNVGFRVVCSSPINEP
jgi:formylglycine-generating enzyme required for sulfatase activity